MCADGDMDCRNPGNLIELKEDTGAIARASCHQVTAPIIRAMIRERQIRNTFFGAQLFGEPAWDIMLDLFAARLEGKQISVSSACMAAGVSQSTAMRWVTRLTNCGLLLRKADPEDGRRTNVELSDEAIALLTNCIVAGRRTNGLVN